MEPYKTNGILLEGLYDEWLNTLLVYGQQIENLESVIKQIMRDTVELSTRNNMQAMLTDLRRTKIEIETLSNEVFVKRAKVARENEHEQNVVSLHQLIENNRLRERVIKAEQSVFYLKYEVNKLLSLAS